MENDPAQILLQRELTQFVSVEDEVMARVHFREIQVKLLRRPPACVMIPAVRQQDATNVQKQTGDGGCFLHRLGFIEQFIAAREFARLPKERQRRRDMEQPARYNLLPGVPPAQPRRINSHWPHPVNYGRASFPAAPAFRH